MSTHTFQLPSGPECEVKPLLAKHQRIITEQSKEGVTSNLDKVLVDTIVRIGSETNITEDFIQSLLAVDRKMILIELRQFSLGFPKMFEFNFEYKDQDGAKIVHPFDVDISEGFNVQPLRIPDGQGGVLERPYKEYSELVKTVDLILPDSKKKVQFTMLDGKGEQIGANTKRKDRSSHTPIQMRRPKYEGETKSGNPIMINLDLDNLTLNDIEYLRKSIKEVEGTVDTEFMFEHPEAEYKGPNEKDVVVDLITQVAFFFPSQAI